MAVADRNVSLVLTGNGDVLEPEDGLIGIGSGGSYALAAARALIDIEGWTPRTIARKAMEIAADICVYTNHNVIVENCSDRLVQTDRGSQYRTDEQRRALLTKKSP